jgi:glycerol-3-phosphate acyltransferase PlsY
MSALTVFGMFIGGYLIGSIPVAYLVVRHKAKVDIRKEGSGNGGGFNAFSVTHSKAVGVLVGVLDAAKGLAAVGGSMLVQPDMFPMQAVALLGAIAGHNYPVWLKFKGGRGLATTAGGLFVLGFSYTVAWCVIWLLSKLVLRRSVLKSNLIAIFLAPAILFVVPWNWVKIPIVATVDDGSFLFFSCVLSIVLLLGHFDAVRDAWRASRTKDPLRQENPPFNNT